MIRCRLFWGWQARRSLRSLPRLRASPFDPSPLARARRGSATATAGAGQICCANQSVTSQSSRLASARAVGRARTDSLGLIASRSVRVCQRVFAIPGPPRPPGGGASSDCCAKTASLRSTFGLHPRTNPYALLRKATASARAPPRGYLSARLPIAVARQELARSSLGPQGEAHTDESTRRVLKKIPRLRRSRSRAGKVLRTNCSARPLPCLCAPSRIPERIVPGYASVAN